MMNDGRRHKRNALKIMPAGILFLTCNHAGGLLFFLPLLLLLPLLAKVKRKYFMLYSLEAWPFARKYEKELKAFYETENEKPDASWHVDLIGSFEKTKEMKIVLIDKTLLIAFGSAVILPFLPVLAQQVPLKELLMNLIGKIMG
jgi:hypothetical protein